MKSAQATIGDPMPGAVGMVAECSGYMFVDESGARVGWRKVDAIVRAVNAHDALVAALTDAREWIEDRGTWSHEEMRAMIRAALELARKGG